MNIIILGGPGAGKGTQSKAISSRYHIPHISTGDIIRDAARKKTKWGLEAEKLIRGGNFVPDSVMIPMITNVLADPKCENGFILDGFPRNLEQANALDRIFTDVNIDNFNVINLEVSSETILERLSTRRSCSVCGGVVSVKYLKEINICPVCGGEDTLYQRSDDIEEVIIKRIAIYHEVTFPLLDFYQRKNNLITVNGNAKAGIVTSDIINALG